MAAIYPSYLNDSVEVFSKELNASLCCMIGQIEGSPNVITITDSTEAGEQGYQDLLREQCKATVNISALRKIIKEFLPTDILIFPGKYPVSDIAEVLREYKGKIHIDFQYEIEQLEVFSSFGISFDTLILSTSSTLFKGTYGGRVDELLKDLDPGKVNSILLKENRGGARYWDIDRINFSTPAFPSQTAHSVGVGDCFNAVFISMKEQFGIETSLKMASYISAIYASTWSHDEFASLSASVLDSVEEIKEMQGTLIHWEDRQNIHIYIAGPDFPHIDTTWIEEIDKCLQYHNFVSHRPVKENGIIIGNETEEQQLTAYHNDLKLIDKSAILVAVLINDDPGTYVEIGWASHARKPVILFDPDYRATNLFLKKTATLICHTLGEVVDAVYELLGKEEKQVVERI